MTCAKCQIDGNGFNWPSARLCDKCAPAELWCPFCGTWGAVHRVKDASGAWIECAVCHCRGPLAPLEGLAVHEWTRRIEPRLPFEEPRDFEWEDRIAGRKGAL